MEEQSLSVSLNDAADIVRLLRENPDLANLLGETLAAGCGDCHGCRGTKGSVAEEMLASLPLSTQLVLKRERIRQLQQQIEEVERHISSQRSSSQR